MPLRSRNRLRVAAIDFLNPAPLMWDFEHPPHSAELLERYEIHYTQPAQCAIELLEGRADLGLIPIAALTPALAVVPGSVIASLDEVRSIQLVVKLNGGGAADAATKDQALAAIQSIAADSASRSSLAYAQILFRRFVGTDPHFVSAPADPKGMLGHADAALLIGDPALLALEQRSDIESSPGIGPCLWIDLAHEWRIRTGHPWVAAVWAVRPEALNAVTPAQLLEDLHRSREHGLYNIDTLVEEWTARILLPPSTIRHYLTQNISYALTQECIAAISLFRSYAAEANILPPLPTLNFL